MKTFLLLFLFPLFAFSAPYQEDSFYNLETEWTNQDGKTVQLKEFEGHPVVLSMVYMTCPFLCPTITSDIQVIEKNIPEKLRKETRFILVSFDPERDTPQTMKAFMEKRKLDPARWTLMSSKKESKLRELAGLLNFKYQKLQDGEFSHSYLIQALDRKGSPRARVEAVNQGTAAITRFFSEL